MASPVQPRLVGLGMALVVVGAVTLAITLFGVAGADPNAPIGSAIPADRVASETPSRIWPILGGVALAMGAALIGIGLNRWRGQRERV
jgi:hypothetical protein